MGDDGSAADSSESWTNDGTCLVLFARSGPVALSEILRLAALELVESRTALVGTPVHPTEGVIMTTNHKQTSNHKRIKRNLSQHAASSPDLTNKLFQLRTDAVRPHYPTSPTRR